MRRLSALMILATLILGNFSCKKSENTVGEPICKLDRLFDNHRGINYYYAYTNNLLTEVQVPGGRYKIEYSNNKPSRRLLIVGANTIASEKHELIYEGQGLLKQIDFYELVNYQNGQYNMYGKIEFEYFNSVLITMRIYSISNNIPTLEQKTDYTINSAGNVTNCHLIDYLPTIQTADYQYFYDSGDNYFRKNNSFSFLLDPLFFDLDPVLLPMAYSKHNVTSMVQNGSASIVGYTPNEMGDLLYLVLNGYSVAFTFYYKCQ